MSTYNLSLRWFFGNGFFTGKEENAEGDFDQNAEGRGILPDVPVIRSVVGLHF